MFDKRSPVRDALFILSFYLIFHMCWYIGPQNHPAATDTYAFHLVGTLIWKGEILKAYSNAAMKALQAADLGSSTQFFPWPYPLQFDLVAAVLGLLPLALAYLVFIGTTYLAYLAVLRRLAGKAMGAVFGLIVPAIIVMIFAGQNGFLTGLLGGMFVLLFGRRRGWAGLPLGLMIIKPHLALGLGVVVLVKRRWDILAVAIGTVVASSILCALVFGPEAWLAFWANAKEQSRLMAMGSFPSYRMTSLYAALVSWGLGDRLALAAQLAGSAAAIALIVWSHLRGHPERVTLAFAVMATLAISPYIYDYDMPMFGVALALVIPELLRAARKAEWIALHLGIWVATVTGLFYVELGTYVGVATAADTQRPVGFTPTLAGIVYLGIVGLCVALVCRALRQPSAGQAAAPGAVSLAG